MKINELLQNLFPQGHSVQIQGKVLLGQARIALGEISVMGTTEAALIDHDIALQLAGEVLNVIEKTPQRPILFLVDTAGQILSRGAELLCLNKTFAHLAQAVDLARSQGHPTFALVTANAVSGGFLAFGLMADRTDALAGTEVRVMDLKAMSRVTKIDHTRLTELAQSSPIFAPGAENYLRMGALEKIWDKPTGQLVDEAFQEIKARATRPAGQIDQRQQKGLARGGRLLAAEINAQVR